MQALRLNQDIAPLSEFRANIATKVENLRKSQRPLLLTQHGKGVAVVLGVDEFEAMRERLEVLSDIEVARQQVAAGSVLSSGDAHDYVTQRLSQ